MFGRLIDRLEETISAGCLAAAALIVFADVVHRYSAAIGWLWDLTQHLHLSWAQELAIFLVIWSAKFGAAYGVRTGIHLGVDLLVAHVPRGWQRALTVLGLLLGVAFTAVIAVFGMRWVLFMHEMQQVSADLELPLWIAYLCVPLGSALMCARFAQVLANYVRRGTLPVPPHAAAADLAQ